MKKQYAIASLAIIFSMFVQAQYIINGGFENWANVSYENSSDWYTSVGESYRKFGVNNATKSTDKVSGNFAIKLETILNAQDTTLAYFANGDPGSPSGQGIPFSQAITHVRGYFKNAQVATDFGVLWLIFKKAGVVIQDTVFLFPGVNATYIPFMHDLKLGGQVPDTLIVAGASSDPFTGNIKNGSWIQFDSLTFENSGTKVSIPGGNFENWKMTNYEDPSSWSTVNSELVPYGGTPHAEKTTDKYSGSLALKLTTRNTDVIISSITSGFFGPTSMGGGDPYTGNIKDTLIGYYKYFPVGVDSGKITVYLSKNGASLGGSVKPLPPTGNSYVYFELPFTMSQLADTIRVDIFSSNPPADLSNVGSTLYIDGLTLKSELSTSVKEQFTIFKKPLYPNPAGEYISADIVLKEISDVVISIFDVTGKVVYRNQHSNMPSGKNQFRVNISSLKPGIYIYELMAGEQHQTSRFSVK